MQSQPKMSFPGGILIGDDAGTLILQIKGSHTAMKSGMIAAETVSAALEKGENNTDLQDYALAYKNSWAYKELYKQRNFGPAQHKFGSILGSAYAFIDLNLFNGLLPWTMKWVADHETLKPADQCQLLSTQNTMVSSVLTRPHQYLCQILTMRKINPAI